MYDNGTKETMRGWMWNRICEFFPRSQRARTTALYLSGEGDRDRAVAIGKGFKHLNLIAVDRSQSAIDAVRGNKGLGICGDLFDVIIHRPFGSDPDVVVADLMGGIYRHTYALMHLLLIRTKPTVVAFNLKRGRDPWGRLFKEAAASANIQGVIDRFRVYGDVGDVTKHRGFLLLTQGITELYEDADVPTILNEFEAVRPSIASYRSKDDCAEFDLVVFRVNPILRDVEAGRLCDSDIASTVAKVRPKKSKKIKQRVVANKATRTRLLGMN